MGVVYKAGILALLSLVFFLYQNFSFKSEPLSLKKNDASDVESALRKAAATSYEEEQKVREEVLISDRKKAQIEEEAKPQRTINSIQYEDVEIYDGEPIDISVDPQKQ
jgi:hypothetical protein